MRSSVRDSLFPLLRALIDRRRTAGRFILLGSASPELLRSASESLAGRIAYMELAPFNLMEVHEIRSLRQHWFRGGFPLSLLAPDDHGSRSWLDAFIRTYIEQDLPILGLSVSPSLMRRFWTMLAHYHGGIWNASAFARALGISIFPHPVIRYLDFLEDAFIVHRLAPFHSNMKKRLVKAPKIYLRDSGLLHRLAGISTIEDLYGNVLIGHSFEGYVSSRSDNAFPVMSISAITERRRGANATQSSCEAANR